MIRATESCVKFFIELRARKEKKGMLLLREYKPTLKKLGKKLERMMSSKTKPKTTKMKTIDVPIEFQNSEINLMKCEVNEAMHANSGTGS